MARPHKVGLDYFSIDIDMDEDDKIIDLLEELGSQEGIGSLYFLLNAIYKNGYYLEWNDSVMKKLCRKKHLDRLSMEKAVDFLTGRKLNQLQLKENPTFFDNKMYRENKILTSKGIQQRYIFASQRRSCIVFNQKYILLEYEFGDVKRKKRIDGKYTEVIEKIHYVLDGDKKIPFDFAKNGILSASTNPIDVNDNSIDVNTNYDLNESGVNVNTNEVNVNTSTQSKVKRQYSKKKEKEKVNRKNNTFPSPDSKKSYSSYNSKPKANEFESFKSLSDQIGTTIDYWNEKGNLPNCKYNVTTLPNIGEVNTKFDVFGYVDIQKSIDYLSQYIEKEKYKPTSFDRFIIKSIDRWLESAEPWKRYTEKAVNGQDVSLEDIMEFMK